MHLFATLSNIERYQKKIKKKIETSNTYTVPEHKYAK